MTPQKRLRNDQNARESDPALFAEGPPLLRDALAADAPAAAVVDARGLAVVASLDAARLWQLRGDGQGSHHTLQLRGGGTPALAVLGPPDRAESLAAVRLAEGTASIYDAAAAGVAAPRTASANAALTCCAAVGRSLVVGAADGRLLVLEDDAFLGGAGIGAFELHGLWGRSRRRRGGAPRIFRGPPTAADDREARSSRGGSRRCRGARRGYSEGDPTLRSTATDVRSNDGKEEF